ncbi:hypothetical protein [Sinorhizobium terangae]|uniref:hypothetical protein n=1 Tax=Sinorhizobium terangae TaxID=110322 RepID=UPI0024B07786|nr:hypothetical protein [Sinorhizobium terangae]WFU51152.1 hypothetical protein QA637_21405 [Sinorhizobium terangae]
MPFETAIQTYFTGMRNEGLYGLLPIGLVLLSFATLLLLRGPRDTFTLWSGSGLGIVGLIGVVAGVGFAIHAGNHLPETLSSYAAHPSLMLQSEAERINSILRGSYGYYAFYGTLMVAAFILLFTARRDWSIGLALPLMAFAAMAFCMDIFIDNRTIAYQEAIAAAQPALPDR